MTYDKNQPWIKRIIRGKSGIILLVTAFAFVALNTYRMNDPLPVGYEVPNFELTNINGVTTTINSFNKPTVILFYKANALFANMMYNSTYKKFLAQFKFLQDKDIANVVVLIQGYSNYKDLTNLLDDRKILPAKNILYASDTKVLSKQFGVRSYPHLFVINEDGVIIYESKLATPEYIQKMLWRE